MKVNTVALKTLVVNLKHLTGLCNQPSHTRCPIWVFLVKERGLKVPQVQPWAFIAICSLQEPASKSTKKERSCHWDENENKNSFNKIEYSKAIERSSQDGGSERLGLTLGMSGGLPLQRNLYPLAPFLTAPLMTNYSTVDPLTDTILWASLLPNLPSGSSRIPEVGSFSHTVNFHKLLYMPTIW